MKKYKKVEVVWKDSTGITPRWEFIDDMDELKPSKCSSIGYILENKKKYITLVQTISKDQILGRLTIPKGAIIEIKRIKYEYRSK